MFIAAYGRKKEVYLGELSERIGIVMEIDLVLESVYAVFLGGGMWLKLGEFVVVKE